MTSQLAPASLAALAEIRAAFPSQPIALVGAVALSCHIPMRWRHTADLDLAIAISVEDASRRMGALPGWNQNRRKEHEWTSPKTVTVDILPVSEEALERRVLVWPRSQFQMSLLGMRHAFAAPLHEFGGGLIMALPSVPVIVLLKMVAYLDRPAERERDLVDLAHVFNEYPSPDDDRLYADTIYEHELTIETAAPFVLGREIAAIVDPMEAEVVRTFLGRVRTSDLPRFVMLGPWSRFEPERVEARLDAFRSGFEDHR